MTGKRSLRRRLENLEAETATSALWRRFLEGEYDPANPPEQIAEWIAVYEDSPRALGMETDSFRLVPAGLDDPDDLDEHTSESDK